MASEAAPITPKPLRPFPVLDDGQRKRLEELDPILVKDYLAYEAKTKTREEGIDALTKIEQGGYNDLLEKLVAARIIEPETTPEEEEESSQFLQQFGDEVASQAKPIPTGEAPQVATLKRQAGETETPQVEKLTASDKLAALEAATALKEQFVALPERELSETEKALVLEKTHDILGSRFNVVKLAILAASKEEPPDLAKLEESQQTLTNKKIEAFEAENPGLSTFVSAELIRTELGLELMAAVVVEAIKIPEDTSHSLDDYLTVYVTKPEELVELHKIRPNLPEKVPQETIDSIEGEGGAIDQLNQVVEQFELDLPSVEFLAAIDKQIEIITPSPKTPRKE